MNKGGQETLSKQLLNLRAKTAWNWARICPEFYRVMGHEGPSHTTLLQVHQKNRAKRPNVVTKHYVRQESQKLTVEYSPQ
ncbi:MAG: hypothetical protein IH919_07050 [Deltaproteobacteria bacterium]|nr:hypothetical protein [Deltaproteobacteria bacterium]